jgi:hypothetical protein
MAASAQTTVNGGRIFTGVLKSNGASATVDFSGASSTVPVQTGLLAARPASCNAGQMYFATDAPAGQNLSYCAGSPGVWATATGGSGGSLPSTVVQTNQSNAYSAGTQDFSGSAHTLPAKKGATAALPSTCTVGEEYFATDATAGQNKYYCTAANSWTQQLVGGSGSLPSTVAQTNQSNTYSAGTQDFTGSAHTLPAKKGSTAALPSTCTVGEEYFATDATAGQNMYYCTAANSWTQQLAGSGSGGGGAAPGGVSGSLQKNNGSGGLSGQGMLYSNIYGGGAERQLGSNCTPKMTIPYTAFTAAAVVQQIKVASVPGYWFPTAILLNESAQFTSGNGQVTALAGSIGTAASPSYYLQPLALMQVSPNFKADNVNGQPASLQAHDIYLQVNVANANPGNLGTGTATNLTAGSLEVALCGGTWQ